MKIFDTTLRDGQQGETVSFSVSDMVRVAQRLSDFGIHYIEGGWPGAVPKATEFFRAMEGVTLNSKLVAFGSTCRVGATAKDDAGLKALVSSKASVATIFGKAWDLHVESALKTSLNENLRMVRESIAFLKDHFEEVFFDAEHFFDGYKANRDYALRVLSTAQDAGADCLVLCDTNGGTRTLELISIIKETRSEVGTAFGIHAHNDSEMAVANSLSAIELGGTQVQGTINGYGERCGNANLCSVIPALELKMGLKCLPEGGLSRLREVSRFVAELANLSPVKSQPYVGNSAFAHKGGMHVSAVQKERRAYEHVEPFQVGNERRILVSDQAGKSNMQIKAHELGFSLSPSQLEEAIKKVKEKEAEGYQFEAADASLWILLAKITGKYRRFFRLESFRVITEWMESLRETESEATIRLWVNDKRELMPGVLGNGPVNALDNALSAVLSAYYPILQEVRLTDYKVRVSNGGQQDSAAKVMVLAEFSDGRGRIWNTVGVSCNNVEAYFEARADSVEYYLLTREAN